MIEETSRASKWPQLDQLLAQKKISYFEHALTSFLLKSISEASVGLPFLLCHLTLATKKGHLCIQIEEQIFPPVNTLWGVDGSTVLSQSEISYIEQHIKEAHEYLGSHAEIHDLPLVIEGNLIYFQKYWAFETIFLEAFKKHLTIPPKIKVDIVLIHEEVKKLQEEGVLLAKQAEAIINAIVFPLTFITGGPGTGKTYTAGHLVRIFWNYLCEEDRKNCRLILCAPTGKAATQLQKSLSRATSSIKGFPLIEAKTLHSLLGIRQGREDFQDEVKRIDADFVIVDESSMIDVKMMSTLLSAIKKGSRCIFLGDKNQLPPVEAGSIFSDVVDLQKKEFPCVCLDVCLRAEQKAILDFAESVNQKDKEKVFSQLKSAQQENEGVVRLHFSGSMKEIQRHFLDYVVPYFLPNSRASQDSESWMASFQKMRILSPLREGPLGFETLNELIFERIQSNIHGLSHIAIPIMIATNDYGNGLFNGETGVLIRKLPMLKSFRREDKAFFSPQSEGNSLRQFPAFILPKYTLAYCLSVHKSQGSEFEKVVLVLPEGSESFGKEVLYTAITRAKKTIEILSSDETLEKTLSNESLRLSGIPHRWH